MALELLYTKSLQVLLQSRIAVARKNNFGAAHCTKSVLLHQEIAFPLCLNTDGFIEVRERLLANKTVFHGRRPAVVQPHALVVGSGLGGQAFVRALSSLAPTVRITCIDPAAEAVADDRIVCRHGLADAAGWCPVNARSLAETLV